MKIKNTSEKVATTFRAAGKMYQALPGKDLEIPQIHPKELDVLLATHKNLKLITDGQKGSEKKEEGKKEEKTGTTKL